MARNPIHQEDLGRVLQTFGGKSLFAIYSAFVALGVPGVGAFAIAVIRPEHRAPAIAAGCVLVLILSIYVAIKLIAVRTKVEVCEYGLQVLKRTDVNSLRWSDIEWVEVGRSSLNGKIRWGVSLHSRGGGCLDLGPAFWDVAGEPSKFVDAIRRFVPRVEMS